MQADLPPGDDEPSQPVNSSGAISIVDFVKRTHFDEASPLLKRQIAYELTYGLFAIQRTTIGYTIVFSTLSVLTLWDAVSHSHLLAWYGVMWLAAIGRHLTCLRFEKAQPPEAALKKWRHRIWAASIVVGLGWCAMVGLVWSVPDAGIIAFVVCMLAFLAIGAYVPLGFHTEAYLGYALPMFFGIGAMFYHVTQGLELAGMLVVTVLATLSMVVASLSGARIWRSTFVFLHKFEDLAQEHRQKSTVLSSTLNSISDGVITVDRNGLVTYLNPVIEQLTGLTSRETIGKNIAESLDLIDEAAGGVSLDLAAYFKDDREIVALPGELTLNNQKSISVDITISPLIYESDQNVGGYVVTLRDVTLARAMARDLSHQALHDSLTGILNRRGFEARLQGLIESRRNLSSSNVVFYIDLDKFKSVNDALGHEAGDQVLRQVVTLIQGCIRDSDSFARLGGDEFAVLLAGCPLERGKAIAEQICTAVAVYRYQQGEREFAIGASIGVVPMLADDSLKGLIKAADQACYRAKEAGRNQAFVDDRIKQ